MMDGTQFDDLARLLTQSRRSLFSGALAAAAGLLAVAGTDARKKRKRKKRKPTNRIPPATPNAFGCLNVNDPCTSADQCCSGICEGTQGQRTCRAHDSSDCVAGTDFCAGEEVNCTTDSGENGLCGTTTGNAGYCLTTGDCYPCRTDVECQRANNGFFGATAACLPCALCADTGGTACVMAVRP